MTINALHLASFTGNIGDTANNTGFRQSVWKDTDLDIEFDCLEIRRFNHRWGWGYAEFNSKEFIEEVNKYDLFVIGGGNFLKLDSPDSNTGCILDFEPSTLRQIDTPIFLNRVGFHSSGGVASSIKSKRALKRFVNNLIFKGAFLTVRNDGSMENLERIYDKDFASNFIKAPDGGFFLPEVLEEDSVAVPTRQGKSVALNITEDFRLHKNKYESFIKSIARALSEMMYKGAIQEVIFIPHIHKDIEAISRALKYFPDPLLRQAITVAPYVCNNRGLARSLFNIYNQCALSIGMRYHSNVVNIASENPIIGFYHRGDRIKAVHDELGLRMAKGIEKDVSGWLKEKLEIWLNDLEGENELKYMMKEYNREIQYSNYCINNKFKRWLKNETR